MENFPDVLKKFQDLLGSILLGKAEVVEKALSTMIAGGHLLLEDFPGVGKTTLAQAIARGIGGTFSRVQFTADLLPSDVLGVRIYRRGEEKFEFVPGPIFANVVLADELNRAPPKTQSSLLQSMSEGQISIDRETIPLPSPFFVIATQNPRGYHGTYPLPESQRDRFMMRLSIGFPDQATEINILSRRRELPAPTGVEKIISLSQIMEIQAEVRKVVVPEPCLAYLTRLASETRGHPEVQIPISPRGIIALMQASQALAYVRSARRVDLDIIKDLAPSVLAHRLSLRSLGQTHLGEGATMEWVKRELLAKVPVE